MGVLRRLKKDSLGRRRISRVERVPFGYARKMSDVLVDFAQPLLDTARSEDDFRLAIMIAAACWNLSLLPESERSAPLQQLTSSEMFKPGLEASQELERHMRALVARKEALFPDDKRVILDYQVSGGPRDGYVEVRYEAIKTK
jgi:hypothetical protein